MFDATQMPFYVKNNLILFKTDDQRKGRSVRSRGFSSGITVVLRYYSNLH